jgi:hypothetical protein
VHAETKARALLHLSAGELLGMLCADTLAAAGAPGGEETSAADVAFLRVRVKTGGVRDGVWVFV